MRFWPQNLDILPGYQNLTKRSVKILHWFIRRKNIFSERLQNIMLLLLKVVAQYLEMALSSAELESCENEIITDEIE